VIGEMPEVIHFAFQGLMPAVFAVRIRFVLFQAGPHARVRSRSGAQEAVRAREPDVLAFGLGIFRALDLGKKCLRFAITIIR